MLPSSHHVADVTIDVIAHLLEVTDDGREVKASQASKAPCEIQYVCHVNGVLSTYFYSYCSLLLMSRWF